MSFLRIKSKLTATALVSTLAIVPVAAGVVAVTLPARAQTDTARPAPPPPGPKEGPKAEHHGDRMGGDMNHDRPGDRHGWRESRAGDRPGRHHRNHAMRLAKRLAGVETAIGIRSDQLDTWRRFTSLLVAFASPQWPDMAMTGADDEDADGDPAMAPDAATAGEDTGDDAAMAPSPSGDTAGAETDTGTSSFGPLGFMVDRAIERGDKAKELKDAMAKLDAVLTPEQKQAARMLMGRQGHGMRGHGHWGDHGPWGDDDRRGRGGDRR